MNATENLVEIYYRFKGCFTATDIKVAGGNNRQFDILAHNIREEKFYHIEVSVTHNENWTHTLSELNDHIGYKFFGIPNNKRPENKNTDFAKGKTYLPAIKATYEKYGVPYDKVIRVFCIWYMKNPAEDVRQWQENLARMHSLKPENFELLLFRDDVMDELYEKIGTSNYDDNVLRTFSLLIQRRRQTQK